MKLKALIVDDEHSGRATLKILLKRDFSYLFDKIITSSSLEEAIIMVSDESFDICFLDIELGSKSGFDFLPYLPSNTTVIFVTAYSEYAIKAVREKAFDYLLKPINPMDLKQAIDRYENEITNNPSSNCILIKEHGFTIPIPLNEIHYIEAKGPYSKIYLVNSIEYTTSKTLKSLTDIVGQNFIRIHKSYTINRAVIKSFKKNSIITINDICLPVSRVGAKVLSQYF